MKRLLAALALGLLTAPPASAQSADQLGLAVVGWVQSIDARPDWQARLDGLRLNEGTRSASIASLRIAAEAGGMEVELRDITLDGYSEPAGGGFLARSLRVGGITVKKAENSLTVANAELRDIAVPALAGVPFQRRQPFTSLLPILAAVAQSTSAGGSIDEIAISERQHGVDSRIAYRNLEYTGVGGGKIESVRAAPLTVESPSRNPLVTLTIGRGEARGIDLDAFLEVYDPARYTGIGDRTWRTAVAHTRYADLAIEAPGMTMKIADTEVENFSVRQPTEAFAPLADASLTDTEVPPEVLAAFRSRYLADLLGAYGVGKLVLNDITFNASGIDELSLERLFLSEASTDRIGELAFEGFIGAVPGQGGIAFKRLAVGAVVPPPVDRLVTAAEQSSRGLDVDISALAPQVGFFEARGVNFQAVDFPGATLAGLRIDSSDYVGPVPATTSVRIEGLDIPVAPVLPARAAGIVTSLGYDRLDTDLAFDLNWDADDQSFKLAGFDLDIADFGKTTADIVLAGVTRAMLEAADPAALLAGIKLASASLTFEDKSVVDRSLSMRADLLKVPVDRLKQQLAGALPLMLAFVGNPDMVKTIVPVLQTFIKTPGTLTVEAKPTAPIPVSEIVTAAGARPQSLPGILSLSLSGTPGEAGDAPTADEPASAAEDTMRRTLAPASRPETTGSTAKP